MADGPQHNSQNGTGQNGTGQNGTGQNGTGQNGTGQNGTGQNGSGQNGSGQNDIDQKNDTGQNGTHPSGTGDNGTAAQKCTCKFPRIHTDDDGTEIGTINKIMRNEFLVTSDGAKYSRRHVCDPNPNQWKEVNKPVRPKTPPKEKMLWVVRQTQIEKNPHWSLFAATDDNSDVPRGRVWQVNGDPDVGMHYAHRPPEDAVAMFLTRSFLDKLFVCTLDEDQEAELDNIANTIPPPGPSQTSPKQRRKIDFRRGTCRTWVWDVLDQLVAKGIATADVAAKARALQPMPLK